MGHERPTHRHPAHCAAPASAIRPSRRAACAFARDGSTTSMRTDPGLRRVCLSLLILFALSGTASAAMVRGRLERVDQRGSRVPAGGVMVTVRQQNSSRSSPVSSGQDGLYYVYNVPAGRCFLEVWVRGTRDKPTVYPIQVREPYTDIPPIQVP
jgi:hypothetical protein